MTPQLLNVKLAGSQKRKAYSYIDKESEQKKIKSTKVQNPRRKCSTVVETNCLVAEYRMPYRIGPRTIITHAHRAPLIDGLGHATWTAT